MTQNVSVSWRLISPQDESSLIALYDLAFGVAPSSGMHFTDDFPIWNPKYSVSRRTQLGGYVGERLIATASSRACETLEGHSLRIIGGVVVHPEFRGKGLASEGVSELLSQDEGGHGTFVLWGSEKTLYSKFGFNDAGTQKRAPLSAFSFVKPIASSAPSRVTMGWNEKLSRALLRRSEGLKITEVELPLIRTSKNIQWISIESGDRHAYAGIGKGIDLQGVIHTWGGDSILLGELLDTIRSQVSEHLEIIWHPMHESRHAFFLSVSNFVREPLLMLRTKDDSLRPESMWFWGVDSA